MQSANGKAISPDQLVTLPSGKQVTAAVYNAKLNEAHQELNARGFPTNTGTTILTGAIVTPVSTLSGQATNLVKPVGKYKTPAELKKFMDPTILSTGTKAVVLKQPLPITGVLANELHSLKVINETYTKSYSFGSPSTFQAAVYLSLNRYANVMGTDQLHPSANQSDYRISGAGKIYASLFNHSFDIFRSNGSFEAPADPTKKLKLDVHANILGIDIFNLSQQYDQRKTLSGGDSRDFDKHLSVSFPIIPGYLNISGEVGIKGTIGYEYSGTLDHTLVSAEFKPFAEISGYAEGGVSDPLGIFTLGVGGELTVCKGDIDMSASFGVANQDGSQIWLSYVYNVEYDLQFLNGELYAFADYPGDTYRTDIFSWNGPRIRGTYADGRNLYNIYNATSFTQPLTQ
jgi:hypothetical protein